MPPVYPGKQRHSNKLAGLCRKVSTRLVSKVAEDLIERGLAETVVVQQPVLAGGEHEVVG